MSAPIFISVIVPFHDEEEFIEDCIKALLSQGYPREHYEVIMVDNNSTDRSAEITRRYPQIRLLRESKPGAYAARNRGVAEASGDVVALTDSDCAPRTDWLERIAETMAESQVHVVQGRTRFATESQGLAVLSDYEAEKAAFTFSGRADEIYYGYSNNMAVRRNVFDRVGPFVEWQRGADVIFVHKVIGVYSCDAVRYRPDICIRHLEVTSPWQWFRKMNVYGRSFRGYGRIVRARPLNNRERLRVFRATIRHGGYSVMKSLLLIVLLSAGAVAYELGRLYPARIT
jgi:glycosyltransferase involved in cell wall biosynthesis